VSTVWIRSPYPPSLRRPLAIRSLLDGSDWFPCTGSVERNLDRAILIQWLEHVAIHLMSRSNPGPRILIVWPTSTDTPSRVLFTKKPLCFPETNPPSSLTVDGVLGIFMSEPLTFLEIEAKSRELGKSEKGI
jgi:hypothetical protein